MIIDSTQDSLLVTNAPADTLLVKQDTVGTSIYNIYNVIPSAPSNEIDYVAIAIGFIALTTLIASISYYRSIKSHNKLSVKPLLIFRASVNASQGRAKYYIANKGIGPLRFTHFEMIYNDETYNRMWPLFDKISKDFGFTKRHFVEKSRSYILQLKNYALTPNDEKNLVKYRLDVDKVNSEQVKKFYSEFKKIRFVFKYEDLYSQEETGEFNFGDDFHYEDERDEA